MANTYRTYLKSKIHGMRVTGKSLHYDGSQSLPPSLMTVASIRPGEQVHIANVNNGERWITYAIEGEEGECVLNGAAARMGEIGDELIIMTYVQSDCPYNAEIIHVNKHNKIKPKK